MSSTSHLESVRRDSNPHGAMAEVLGQRSVLGFGVVLAWLVLFHLLVNIWLLCVFTSLLVVLGGWLGSQAVLESNSVVHLERFITLEQVQLSSSVGTVLSILSGLLGRPCLLLIGTGAHLYCHYCLI